MQAPVDRSCPSEDVLAAFVAGALEPDEAHAIERHIDGCATCYHVLATYSKAWAPAASGPSASTSDRAVLGTLQRFRALSPGSAVGRYVVLEWVGEGGSGVVYAAYDPELDRKIALKLVQPHVPDAVGMSERLLREARAMARLAHRHVVAAYDAGTFEGQVYIAMEFVEGTTLRAWLRKEPHSARDIVGVFVEAGRGLAAAHARGLVHRDFKPENVLMGKDGRVCVTDFGLAFSQVDERGDARSEDPSGDAGTPAACAGERRATRTSATAGTPAYMAPEQKLGRAVDARSDQYSYCVALYEALSGEHPFAPRGDGPPRDAPSWSGIPARLRRILAPGLEASAEARHPSMQKLLADLDEGATRSRARGPRVAGVLAVSFTLVALAYRWRSPPPAVSVCTGAERKLVGVWDEPRRRAIEAAFLATGKPYALNAWRGTEAALDTYAKEWVATHVEACEATRVRGEQSTELLDLRMACLADRLDEMGALTGELARADEKLVTNADHASQGLTRIARCSDRRALTARVKAPADAAMAGKVEDLRRRLAELKAMDDAGRYRAALPLAAEVADAARATGLPAIEGEALYRYGNLQSYEGDGAAAQSTLREAAWTADAAGDDRTRVLALGTLLYLDGYVRRQKDEVAAVRREGEAALARIGRDDDIEAQFLGSLGTALVATDARDDARRAMERALALREGLYGPDSAAVARSLLNLGALDLTQGHLDAGIAETRRALVIGEHAWGPQHPRVALLSKNLAGALFSRLDVSEAEIYAQRAVAIYEAALGPKHPSLLAALIDLGAILLDGEQAARALGAYQRALALQEKDQVRAVGLDADDAYALTLGGIGEAYLDLAQNSEAVRYLERALALPPFAPGTADLGNNTDTPFVLAQALTALGREPRRAHDLAIRTRNFRRGQTSKTPRDERNLAQVEAWLVQHPL
jgi:tetratricopeptide (TPR) repeat protein